MCMSFIAIYFWYIIWFTLKNDVESQLETKN